MSFKLIARNDSGQKIQVDPASISGANVVLNDVSCDISVYVGAAVRMTTGGTALNAIADSLANSNVIGIVESKPSTTTCNIRVLGVSLSIYTGLDVTKEYYLSDSIAGEIQTSTPTSSGSVILKLGQPFSDTEFLMTKGQRTVRL